MLSSQLCCVLALWLAIPAAAQTVVRQFGPSGAVACIRDVDGDGSDEVVLADPVGSATAGTVRVHSGRTGAVLHVLQPGPQPNRYATCIAGVGDADGDGFDDVAVGIPRDAYVSPDSGHLYVWSGRTGTLLWHRVGRSWLSFARSVHGAGDVNADGFDDVVVGNRDDSNSGDAIVCSGRDGHVLWARSSPHGHDDYGASVAGIGDVNGDGFDDVIVGFPTLGSNSIGSHVGGAEVLSGRDGRVMHLLIGHSSDDYFGSTVQGIGDIDADLVPDFIIGASSYAETVRGGTFQLGWYFAGSIRSAVGVGDIDGDGHADVAVADGAVRVLSGSTRSDLTIIPDPATWIAAGDINGDGHTDLVSGGPNGCFAYDLGFPGHPGRIRRAGVGCIGSNAHLPRARYQGSPLVGHAIRLTLRGAQPLRGAVLNLGGPVNVPLGSVGMSGCTLLAGTGWFNFPFFTDAFGMTLPGPIMIPGDPSLVGATLSAQWACLDANANSVGITLSDGILIEIGG